MRVPVGRSYETVSQLGSPKLVLELEHTILFLAD